MPNCTAALEWKILMILKEIEMDIPFVSDEENKSLEGKRLEYDLKWKEKRREFQLSTRCMTSEIERRIPKIVTKDCWKIQIQCVEHITKNNFENLLGVYCIEVGFDINKYFEMPNLEKKKYIIEKIMEVLNNPLLNKEFELSSLREVCLSIIAENYKNIWYWKKPIRGKNLLAQIKIIHDVDKISIYVEFRDEEKKNIKEYLLAEEIPDEREYFDYLGELSWASENTVKLETRNGKIYYQSYE